MCKLYEGSAKGGPVLQLDMGSRLGKLLGIEGDRPLNLNNLAKKGWLADKPDEFKRKIASLGRWVILPAGVRIYSVGDPSDAMIGIDQGHLDVLSSVSPDEEAVFYRAGPGFWLGDRGLLKGDNRGLSVETATSSRLFKLPHASLRRHLATHPADWAHLYDLALERGEMAARYMSEVLALAPTVKIARTLLRLSLQGPDVVAKQEDLAKLTGMSRATFRRAVEILVASGAVKTKYGRLEIVDRRAVEEQADML